MEEGLKEEIAETPESGEESYYFEFYKYPAAKFGDKEPFKLYTMTLYQDTDIVRMMVDGESLHMAFLPEEMLTFYYRISEEEMEFYNAVLAEE